MGLKTMSDILGERDPSVPDTPTRVAEPSRESQLPKRFYKSVNVFEGDDFQIQLDGKPVRTPGKAVLASSSKDIADKIANEWDAQGERIDPMTMPVTRLTNTAIDGVASDMQAVKEDIIRYVGTDLLCYRAGGPEDLVDLHRKHWDPVLDWAQSSLSARFNLAEGVMHVEQPPESIAAFSVHVGAIDDPLVLAGTHVVTSLTGSALISMAVVKNELSVDEAWSIAHVDEDWNISLWGEDFEASERRAKRFIDMQAACFCIRALT